MAATDDISFSPYDSNFFADLHQNDPSPSTTQYSRKRPHTDDPSTSRAVALMPSDAAAVEEDDAQQQPPPQLQPQPQPRVDDQPSNWWIRYDDPNGVTEAQFRAAFGMSRATFDKLCEDLTPELANRGTDPDIPIRKRVAVCLSYVSTGDSALVVSRRFGLPRPTCIKLVLQVCSALTKANPPSAFWIDLVAHVESVLLDLENVIGTMFTTRVPVNPNKTTSTNTVALQGSVNFDSIFTDVYIDQSGDWMTDDKVLEKSRFFERNKSVLSDKWVVGGPNYPLHDRMLVPYHPSNMTWAQRAFNEEILSALNVAKNACAKLKGRWKCLQNIKTESNPQDLKVIIEACCVLHNTCEMNNDKILGSELCYDQLDDEVVAKNSFPSPSLSALQARDNIAKKLLINSVA